MRNTRREQNYQAKITDIMLDQGYATMARLFNMFTLILTDDPNCVGYTQFDQAIICLNENLNDKGFSVVARHELLHQFMDHHARIIKHVAKKMGLDPEQDIDTLTRKIYGDPKRKDNSAADWDLSRLYSEDDVRLSRNLSRMFREEVAESYEAMKGLILEDDHEDWFRDKLTYEEMYDRLEEDESNLPEQPPQDQKGDSSSKGDSGQSGQQGQSGQSGQSGEDGEQGEDQQGSGSGNDGQQSSEDGQDGQSGQGGQSGQRGQQRQSRGSQNGGSTSSEGEHEGSDEEGEDGESSSARQGGNEDGKKKSNGKVQIGDFDPEWQAREAKAREEKVRKEIEQGKQEDMTEEEQKERRLEQVRQLEREKKNPNTLDSITQDVVKKKRQEADKRRSIEAARARSTAFRGDINTFKQDIKTFVKNIRDEADERGRSWSRLDRKNTNPSIMKKGTKNLPSGQVPLVNVYFDWSGSCQPYIKRIKEVLSALQELEEKDHLIRLRTRFFANYLGNDNEDTSVGGGNSQSANDAIIEDIKTTGAENVIILTDTDSNYHYDKAHHIYVRGGVWWLWSDGNKALNFADAIKSVRGQNREYNIH